VQRWWNINAGDVKEYIHVVAGDAVANGATKPAVFPAAAVLGLSPGESTLSSISDIIGREKYDRLEKGGAEYCLHVFGYRDAVECVGGGHGQDRRDSATGGGDIQCAKV